MSAEGGGEEEAEGEDRLGFGSRTDRGGADARNERVSYRVGEIVEVKSWL